MPATSELETVGQYIAESRRLLQDENVPYRYPDQDIVVALGIGLQEARRLRADLFIPTQFKVPYLSGGTLDLATVVPMDEMYRSSFVYYIVGRMQLRDDEATTDARATGLMNKFLQQMIVITA